MSFLPTKLDLFKALSSYNSIRDNVYHKQRIVVECTCRHLFQHGQFLRRECSIVLEQPRTQASEEKNLGTRLVPGKFISSK